MHRSVVSLPQQAFTSIDEWLRHLQTTVEAAPAEEDVAPEDVCNRSLDLFVLDWKMIVTWIVTLALVFLFRSLYRHNLSRW